MDQNPGYFVEGGSGRALRLMRTFTYSADRMHPAPVRQRFAAYLAASPGGIDAHPDSDEQVRLFYLIHGFVAVHPDFLPAYSALLESAFVDEFPGMREELVERAAEEALALISGRDGTFPERMQYSAGENAELFSVLHEAAMLWWQYSAAEADRGDLLNEVPYGVDDAVIRGEDREDAMHLLENLLFADPSDPLEVRYPLLAMLEGMELSEFVRRFPWTPETGYPADAPQWFKEHARNYATHFPPEVVR